MNQEVLTLAPGGLPVAQSLGFHAAAVVVDNYTSSYVTLTDVGKTIPPWNYGAVVPLPPGLTRASAKLTPTVPAVAGPPVPISQCTLTWTDQALPAAPGHLLQQSHFSTREQLWPDGTAAAAQTGPSFTVPAAVNTNKNFTLPAGTTDIRVGSVVSGGLSTTFTTAIFVVGIQTGIRYFPKAGTGQPFGSRQPITVPVDVQQDTQVQVQVSPDGTHAMDVYVSALFAVEAVEIYAQEAIPVTFASTAPGGTPPAPWQAPNLAPVVLNLTLAGGVSQNVIPAVAGQVVYLFTLNRTYDAAVVTEIAVQDTAGTNYHIEQAASVDPPSALFNGAPLPTGLGVTLKNLGANSATLRGSLVASQA